MVEQAILDAQATVEGYLGRAVLPRQFTELHLLPGADGAWPLTHEPVLSVDTITVETDPIYGQPTDYYTVTYTAGLDAANDPELGPIRTYVARAAAADPAVQALAREKNPSTGRVVQSVTVEGQAVTYATAPPPAVPAAGAPGSPITLKHLDRWRLAGRRVYQRPGRAAPPWPYQ